jgi:hypothetical protein
MDITKEEFDDFRIDPNYLARKRKLTNAQAAKHISTLQKQRFASKPPPSPTDVVREEN